MRTIYKEQDGVGVQIIQAGGTRALKIIEVPSNEHGLHDYAQLLLREQSTPFDLSSRT